MWWQVWAKGCLPLVKEYIALLFFFLFFLRKKSVLCLPHNTTRKWQKCKSTYTENQLAETLCCLSILTWNFPQTVSSNSKTGNKIDRDLKAIKEKLYITDSSLQVSQSTLVNIFTEETCFSIPWNYATRLDNSTPLYEMNVRHGDGEWKKEGGTIIAIVVVVVVKMRLAGLLLLPDKRKTLLLVYRKQLSTFCFWTSGTSSKQNFV